MRPFAARLLVFAVVALGLASAAAAQFGFGRLAEGRGVPVRHPPDDFVDGAFSFCKVRYREVRREDMGVGWATDYPYAGNNLMIRLSELTKTPVSMRHGDPNYWVVELTNEALFRCPFTMASDVGTLGFTPPEADRLREYLLKGGFLWVDDFWGTRAWTHWAAELRKVLPEFPIVDVPPDHPIRHTLFDIPTLPQVTNIQFWRRNGGYTAERGSDSPHANFRAIMDDRQRIMVLMTHNTDIGDSWEREGEDHEFFLQFSPRGYALGINVALYAMSH